MNYDVDRMAKIYNHVFSTPRNSPERTARLEALSEADQEALYDYDMGIRSGRIKEVEVKEEMAKERNYEWYKKMMESDESGTMQKVSQFAFECPALYAQYREKRQQELEQERRLHNRRLDENKHKNKVYKG